MNATALTTAIAGIRRKVIVCRIPRQHRQLSNLVDGMAAATGMDDIMVGVCVRSDPNLLTNDTPSVPSNLTHLSRNFIPN
jgi:hypothetical protein